MEDIVIVEAKDYSQVLFEDVQEVYEESVDLKCLFTINDLMNNDGTDYIGIYKVGFKSSKDYLVSLPITETTKLDENKYQVIFASDKLPKDDGEFYQFVYVSASKVKGASTPFQLKYSEKVEDEQVAEKVEEEQVKEKVEDEAKENEEINIDDPQKMSILNMIVEETKEQFDIFTEVHDNARKEMKEAENAIADAKIKLDVPLSDTIISNIQKEDLSQKGYNNDILKQMRVICLEQIKTLHCNPEGMTVFISLCLKHLETLENELESLRLNKIELEESFKIKTTKLTSCVQAELESIYNQMVKLCSKARYYCDDLIHLKLDIENNVDYLAKKLKLVKEEDLNDKLKKLTDEKTIIEKNCELILEELKASNEKLSAAEQCKVLLREQLGLVTNELESMKCKTKLDAEKISELTKENKALTEEKELLVKEITELKKTNSKSMKELDEINGVFNALNMAHQHRENRVKTMEQEFKLRSEELENKYKKLLEEKNKLSQELELKSYDNTLLNNHTKHSSQCLLKRSLMHSNDEKEFELLHDEKPNLFNYSSDKLTDSYVQSMANSSFEVTSCDSENTPIAQKNTNVDLPMDVLLSKIIGSKYNEKKNTDYGLLRNHSDKIYQNSTELYNPYTPMTIKDERKTSSKLCNCECSRYGLSKCQCGISCPICQFKIPYTNGSEDFLNHLKCHSTY